MNVDIATMSLVVSVSSILHAIILVFLFFLVDRYRGVFIYTIGTILSALTFFFYLIRWFYPEFLILRFLGNVIIVMARIFYFIGIARFVQKDEYYVFWSLVIFLSILSQAYFTYIDSSFVFRNLELLTAIIITQILSILYLTSNKKESFTTSAYFTAFILLLDTVSLSFRAIVLPFSGIKHLFHPNMVNTITFFSVLIADQLRNSGFIMMVIQRLQGDLKAQANIDFLTKTFNRRAIQEQLSNEELKYYKMGKTFSVVLLDIDRFKSINDNYGHDGGDIVLKHLSEVLKQNLRKRDILGRWGGEEFIVILPDTPIDRALIVAERLRKSVESNPAANGLIQHTISLGVATFMQHGQTMKKLIKNVDTALYQAKKTGRNKVIKAIEIEVNPNPDRNHRA